MTLLTGVVLPFGVANILLIVVRVVVVVTAGRRPILTRVVPQRRLPHPLAVTHPTFGEVA